MNLHLCGKPAQCRRALFAVVCIVLVGAALGSSPARAQTYVSAEPIPSQEIMGAANLDKILGIGYANLELWSQRLLNDCHFVENTIGLLSHNSVITTINGVNTRYLVAAGGFEAVTDPSFVLTVQDSGPGAATASDIFVLDNALGYVLNQSGTAQFTVPFDKRNPFEFSLDYAVVTYAGTLTGEGAMQFFNHVGTIDPALWSGTNAGFTQVSFGDAALANYLSNNSMLFLIGSVPKHEFEQGLYKSAITSPNMTYWPLAANGNPVTAKAGAAFPGNDWITYPAGDEYLANLGKVSAPVLNGLSGLRQKHLDAVANLIKAIEKGNVGLYLTNQFKCPQ